MERQIIEELLKYTKTLVGTDPYYDDVARLCRYTLSLELQLAKKVEDGKKTG